MPDQANCENTPQTERPHPESSDEQRLDPVEQVQSLFAGYRKAELLSLANRNRAPADVEAAVKYATGYDFKVYLDPNVPDDTVYLVPDNLLDPSPEANMELLDAGPPDAGDLETLRREHDVLYLDGEKIGMIWKPGWAERLVAAIKQVELHPEEIGDDIIVIFEDEPRFSMSVPVTLGEDGDQRAVIPEGSLVPPTYPAAVQRSWLEDDLREDYVLDSMNDLYTQDEIEAKYDAVARNLVEKGWRR